MSQKLFAAGLTILYFSVSVLGAAAHAELVAAEPAPGAQLAVAPTEVRLTFSEPVGSLSSILVFAEGFQMVDGLVTQYNTLRPEEIYVPLPALASGVYTVQWRAASDDGHEISGTYTFSAGLVTPSPTQIVEPEANTPPDQVGLPIWLLVIGGLAIAVPLLLLVWRQRQ